MEICTKNWPLASRLSGPIEVIGTDTDRSDIYDFLLVIHSNCGPILYLYQHMARYWLKIAFCFSYLQAFTTTGEEANVEFCNDGWTQKTTMMGQPGGENSLTISLAG